MCICMTNISTTSEQQLAQKMRRSLLVEIAVFDLPVFLLAEIEQVLFGLNYYKLTNLKDHKKDFFVFLSHMETTYQKSIVQLLRKKWISELSAETKEFGTAYLYKQGYRISLSVKERLKLKSTFAVMCTLQMKEFVYRTRISRPIMQSVDTRKRK